MKASQDRQKQQMLLCPLPIARYGYRPKMAPGLILDPSVSPCTREGKSPLGAAYCCAANAASRAKIFISKSQICIGGNPAEGTKQKGPRT